MMLIELVSNGDIATSASPSSVEDTESTVTELAQTMLEAVNEKRANATWLCTEHCKALLMTTQVTTLSVPLLNKQQIMEVVVRKVL